MVEDVNDEDKFNNKGKAEPAAATQVPPPLPTIYLPVAAATAPRRGSQPCRSGTGSQPYDAYLNLNVKDPGEGTAYLMFMQALGTSFDSM